MIKASKVLVNFIDGQKSIPELAEEFGVTRQTIYNVRAGENVSSELVAKFLNKTGYAFEKAFEVEE